jgi:flagellar basal-body rod protein FlgB
MNDLSLDVLASALHGLSERQRAIADNIANVQTPGYLARRVDFEGNLERAMADGDRDGVLAAATPVTSRSLEATRTDGNNVNLDDETVSALATNLRYQTTVEAVNHKFRLLRSSIQTH